MALHPQNALELFAGGGGLALGLKRAIPGLRTVGYVEREAYAASVLVARMEDAGLDSAPVWDDVATFDGGPWRGVVDLIAGGFPCQDISNAGKRAGITGARSGLWKEYARIIDEVRPEWVFVENVSALVKRGLPVVLGDLASLGFDAEWGCFRASDVGAPHRRERLFLLAHAHEHGRGGAELGDADLAGLEGRGVCIGERRNERLAGPSSRSFPPGPDDRDGWARVLETRPDLEPALCRMADGMANRVERLRLCGNGVVPAQATHAYRVLRSRFDLTLESNIG